MTGHRAFSGIFWLGNYVGFLLCFYCEITFYVIFVLSSIVIPTRGEEGAGRYAGRLACVSTCCGFAFCYSSSSCNMWATIFDCGTP